MFKKLLVLVAAIAAVAAVAIVPGAALAGASITHTKPLAKCPPGTAVPAYCNPSLIKLASIVAVVRGSHRAPGIVFACFGKAQCIGVMTLTYQGTTIGQQNYRIAGNSVGVVRAKLSTFGYNAVKTAGHIPVHVSAVDSDGPSTRGTIKMYFT